jgi:hypothetical protein
LPKSIPTVTGITPPSNGTYSSGQTLNFTVTYSSAVTVTTIGGVPYLSLSAITGSIGAGNLAKATYQSGSGSTALTFSYNVVSADSAPTGLTMSSSITLNGGSIQSGSACAMLAFIPPDLSNVIIGSYLYATDPGNNRVEVFNTSGSFIRAIGAGYNGVSGTPGSSGSGNGQFNLPYDVAADSSGNIWVVDQGNQRVEEFTSAGNFIRSIGAGGIYTNGSFYYPVGVAVDSQNNVWVADEGNNRIQEFNSSGTWLTTMPSGCPNTSAPACPGSAASGQFGSPYYITFDAGGAMWVNDTGNVRAEKFNSSGMWLQSIPASGTFGCQTSSVPACRIDYSNNPMTRAGKIVFDSSGNMWAGDYDGQMTKTNTTTGLITNIYGNIYVHNLAIDASGNLWGGLTGTSLQLYNSSGTLINTYGSQGSGNGQVGNTYFPIPLAIGR